MFAPRGAPGALIAAINADINKGLQSAEITARLAEAGAEPAALSPARYRAFIERENAQWEKVIREKNIQVERTRLAL
jgi:tripartite-type tricarboxylate transporter receptor subunit TctC